MYLFFPSIASSQQQEVRSSITVLSVEIPVTVIKDGKPIEELRKENFEVYDNGKRIEISDFEYVHLEKISSEGKNVPVSARRHFLFLFDLLHSDLNSITKAREAAIDIVTNHLTNSDLAAVAIYSHRGLVLLLGFTPAKDQVIAAIKTFGAPKLVERYKDPLGLMFGDFLDPAQLTALENANTQGGQEFEGTFREFLQSMYSVQQQVYRQESEARFRAFSRSMQDLASMMSRLNGRKFVIFLSEGFEPTLLGDSGGIRSADQRILTDVWQINTEAMFGNTESKRYLNNITKAFRRIGATIYAVDIGRLREGGTRKASGLVALAKDTGGTLFENFNKLGKALGKIVKETSVTYILTIHPTNIELDGSYHKLKVKLVNVPKEYKKAKLYHRPGYYAYPPSVKGKQFAAAEMILEGVEKGDLIFSIVAFPIDYTDDKLYVPVIAKIEGEDMLEKTGTLPGITLEILSYVFNEQGDIVSFFNKTVKLELSKMRERLKDGLTLWWNLLLDKKGNYEIRSLARILEVDRFKLDTYTLPTIPDNFVSAPIFGKLPAETFLILDPKNRPKEIKYPFMYQRQIFVPQPIAEITPDIHNFYILSIINLDSDLQIELESLEDGKKTVLPVKVVGEDRIANTRVYNVEGNFSLVESGKYFAFIQNGGIKSQPIVLIVQRVDKPTVAATM